MILTGVEYIINIYYLFTIYPGILEESINLTSKQSLLITEQIFNVDTYTELAEANREHP